ncbi:MAG: hypothetical protein ACLGJC_13470 [Alphaproteobacteria bacterium]
MARPKPIFTFEPRLMTARDVATYLNRSEQWFLMKRESLEAAGFPRPDPLMGNLYDRAAVDLWLDRRSGLARASAPANDAMPVPANDPNADDPILAAIRKM